MKVLIRYIETMEPTKDKFKRCEAVTHSVLEALKENTKLRRCLQYIFKLRARE